MATAIHTTISALVHVKPGTRIEAHEDFEQTTAWLSVGANGPGPDSHVTLFMGLPDLWRLRSALADLERLLVAQAKASDRCYCGKPASGIGYLPGEVDAYPRACTDHAVPTTVAEPARVVDLMASLEESLAAAKNRATA